MIFFLRNWNVFLFYGIILFEFGVKGDDKIGNFMEWLFKYMVVDCGKNKNIIVNLIIKLVFN